MYLIFLKNKNIYLKYFLNIYVRKNMETHYQKPPSIALTYPNILFDLTSSFINKVDRAFNLDTNLPIKPKK